METSSRARTQEEKEQRRNAILDAARAVIDVTPDFFDATVARIAQRAGLSKGSVFVYFSSKEELFVELTMRELGTWEAGFAQKLVERSASSPLGREPFLALVAQELLPARTLLRLLALGPTLLERNIGLQQALRYKTFLSQRLIELGSTLNATLLGAQPTDGLRIVSYAITLVIGLYPATNPPEVVREVLLAHELPPFSLDFDSSFIEMLRTLLVGMGL